MARQYSSHSQAAADAKAKMAADARKKAFMAKRTEMIAAAVLVAIGSIRLISGVVASSSSEGKIEAVQVQINEANDALERRKAAQGDATMGTVVEVDATVNCAAEAGKQVCNMQNTLSAYMKQMRETGSTKLSTEHQQLLEKLRKNFVDPKGNVRGSWCEYGTWEFDSTFDYEGTSAQVVWKCYNNSDELLACCIAAYNGDMQKFQNAVVYRTVKYADTAAWEAANSVPVQPEPEETTVTTPPETDTTSSTTSESEPIVDIPPETFVVETEFVEPEPVFPEDQWLYGWSKAYQCWGYFNQDGRFLTEEEYQREVNW